MDFRILGPVEVNSEAGPLPLGRAKQRALLAILLLSANEVVSRGRLSEAEELVPQALELGERAQRDAAIPVYRLQRYTLCDFRGTLHEVEPEVRELVAEYPARVVFRCTLSHLYARLGRREEARAVFDELARDGFAALPFDQEWLFGMSFLAETCAFLNDEDAATVLYELLAPHAALNAVDMGEGLRGAVSRYLGILAVTMRRWETAGRHFEDALSMNAAMGVRPWLAYTESDYARMLLARDGPGDRERAEGLLANARATYRELGMEGAVDALDRVGTTG